MLQPGMKLPTHQQLVSQYGVSVGTVKRALGELQGAGPPTHSVASGSLATSSLRSALYDATPTSPKYGPNRVGG